MTQSLSSSEVESKALLGLEERLSAHPRWGMATIIEFYCHIPLQPLL